VVPGVIIGIRLAMSVETGRRLQTRNRDSGLSVSSCREIHGADRGIDELQDDYVPISVNVRHRSTPILLDAVAIQTTQRVPNEWEVRTVEDDEQAGVNFQQMRSTHAVFYKLTFPKPDQPPEHCDSWSLWRKTPLDWGTWNLLDKDPQPELTETCRDGWMPISINRVKSADVFNTHYVHLHLPAVGCHAFASLPLSEFQSKVASYRQRDWRPSLVQSNIGTQDFRLAFTLWQCAFALVQSHLHIITRFVQGGDVKTSR